MKWLPYSDRLLEIHIIVQASHNCRKTSAIIDRFFIQRIWKVIRRHDHHIPNRYYVQFTPNTKTTYPLSHPGIEGPFYEIPQYEYDQLNNLGQPVTMSNTTRYC